MTTPLRLLLADDSEDDAALLTRELKKSGFELTFTRVDNESAMQAALENGSWDIVISDYNMPNFDCFDALALVKKSKRDLPFIVVSAAISEETAVAAMRAGARDYIMKQNLKRLGPAVLRELEEAKILKAKREAEEKLEHQAYHDPLTGLPNLLLFKDRLRQALALAHRYNRSVSVIALDLNDFKSVNNALGWEFGDKLLRQIAFELGGQIREEDTLARMGEDEFILFSLGLHEPEDAMSVVQRIAALFGRPFVLHPEEVGMKATIGVSLYPADGADEETLIKNAEMALHRARRNGKGTHLFYSADINEKSYERFKLRNQLQKAFEANEFLLYYQPEIGLAGDRIVGCEALLRWRHPERGVLAAGEFIALAEETGVIVPIGEWVLGEACRQLKAWRGEGLPHVIPAVNLSAAQFNNPELARLIESALKKYGVDPSELEVEVTESIAMQNLAQTRKILKEIRDIGIRIAIDDFGTGYSSLAYLKDFPVNQIKIDRSFVMHLPGNSKDASIVTAVIGLAHGLGMEVIAEGVETKEQLEFLRSAKCDRVQGYLLGRPAPPDEFARLLRERSLSGTA